MPARAVRADGVERVLAGDLRAAARSCARSTTSCRARARRCAAIYPARRARLRRRRHRQPRRRQVDAGRRAGRALPRARRAGRRGGGRSLEPVLAAARSSAIACGCSATPPTTASSSARWPRAGTTGGLSRSTAASVAVLDAAGFPVIVVETVGVGQDEVDVADAADAVVVVTVPGLGDEVQAIKAGPPGDRRRAGGEQGRSRGRRSDAAPI